MNTERAPERQSAAGPDSQVAIQDLIDGVQDELTPHYHRVVVSNLLNALRALRALLRDLDPQTRQALGKMLHYVQQTTVPDGTKQVAFNDSDPGSPGNFAGELAELGLQEFRLPPSRLGPEVFPYAGVALLRQRQDLGDLYQDLTFGEKGISPIGRPSLPIISPGEPMGVELIIKIAIMLILIAITTYVFWRIRNGGDRRKRVVLGFLGILAVIPSFSYLFHILHSLIGYLDSSSLGS